MNNFGFRDTILANANFITFATNNKALLNSIVNTMFNENKMYGTSNPNELFYYH